MIARAVLVSLSIAFVAVSVPACRNKKEEARQRAELTSDLDQYRAHVGELQKQATDLRARFDKLPEDLPGIGTVRDDVHAIEEGLGVEDGRTKWLAGELDKAFASGKKEEIEKVSKAIPRGDDGSAQTIVKVAHELAPLERLAAQRRFFEALDAAKAQDTQKGAQKDKPHKTR